MHSFLVSVPPDLPVSPDILRLIPDKSLGITEVRELQLFLSRRPLKLPNNIGIILEADKLTLPAQQALLKTLEEPPGNSLIYLVTSQPDALLPTILSRVSCIDASTHDTFNQKNVDITADLFDKILKVGIGERLALLDKQEFTRETALEFLTNLEFFLHNRISSGSYHLPPTTYHLLSQTKKYLKANVNVKLAMDNFVISL